MAETTFTDDSGDVRFSGVIRMGGTAGQVATVQGNGTLAPAPGGVSFGGETLSGNPVTINNGVTAPLTWDTKVGGSDLLDISTPAAPLVLVAGVYAVAVWVSPTAPMTAGGV